MKKNRTETQQAINIRAWRDPAFKKQLLSNPHEALKEFGMKNIPSSIKIRVVEEDSNTWYIVLQKAPENAEGLSERELKEIAAAGGRSKKGSCLGCV